MSKVGYGYNGRREFVARKDSVRAINRASNRIDNELFYIDTKQDIEKPEQLLKQLAAISARVNTNQHTLSDKQKEKGLKLAQDLLQQTTNVDTDDYIRLCRSFPEIATEWRKNPAKFMTKDGTFPYKFLQNILKVTPQEQKNQTIVSNDGKLVTGPTVKIFPPDFKPVMEGLLMAQPKLQGVKVYVSCEQGFDFTPKTEDQRVRFEPFYATVKKTFGSEGFAAAREQDNKPKPE